MASDRKEVTMLTSSFIKSLKFGNIFQVLPTMNERRYLSRAKYNGSRDIELIEKPEEPVGWIFLKVKNYRGNLQLKCILEKPTQILAFKGARGYVHQVRECDEACRSLYRRRGFAYVRSVKEEDINHLLNVKTTPINRAHMYYPFEYTPSSFLEGHYTRQGVNVQNTEYSYYWYEEYPKQDRHTKVIFLDVNYWLASTSISAYPDRPASFCVGEVTKDGFVNMGHWMFMSNGFESFKEDKAYIRPVAYLDVTKFNAVRLDNNLYRLV